MWRASPRWVCATPSAVVPWRLWSFCCPYEIYCNLSATPQMSYYSGQQLMTLTHHSVVSQNYSQRTWTFPAFLIPETLVTVPLHLPSSVHTDDAKIHISCKMTIQVYLEHPVLVVYLFELDAFKAFHLLHTRSDGVKWHIATRSIDLLVTHRFRLCHLLSAKVFPGKRSVF